MRFLLSTIADIDVKEGSDPPELVNTLLAPETAARMGMGLEIAEFCLTDYLDEGRAAAVELIRRKLRIAPALSLHAPFNELFPAAIDPRAAALARERYEDAIETALSFGIRRIVIHTGFAPSIYFDSWFLEQSVRFWRDFLREHPGDFTICLENVMETEPELLRELMERLDDPRLRLTLDVGHAYRSSGLDPMYWLELLYPWILHFHIHNNEGKFDTHNALDDGHIAMEPFLHRALELCPEASFAVESTAVERSAQWLKEKGFLEE